MESTNLDPNDLSSKERTLGDGIDNSLLNKSENSLYQKDMKLNIRVSKNPFITFKPIEPKTKVVYLVPKYIPTERKRPKYLTHKPKEPKFIPYEPYKAAIERITSPKPKKLHVIEAKSSKNNITINHLVYQMSEIRANELNKSNAIKADNESESLIPMQWEAERLAYETDIKNLRETNAHLENQLKFQAQVNGELKTLLVAAVGEDLESRVQHLTEDKLSLARALLNSADHLTSHQEQTEWLSGQCEVWRSKFLASSLMVEELARWKSALTARVNEAQDALKALLDDRYKIQRVSVKTYCSLANVAHKLNGAGVNLKTCNSIEVCNANCTLGQQISDLVNAHNNNGNAMEMLEECMKLAPNTSAERGALKNPVTVSNKQDAICNALRGTAMSISGEQMYLQRPAFPGHTCAHCLGEVKDI